MPDGLHWIAKATRATSVRKGRRIQSLWGGYGELFRVHLSGTTAPSAMKVALPARSHHPPPDGVQVAAPLVFKPSSAFLRRSS